MTMLSRRRIRTTRAKARRSAIAALRGSRVDCENGNGRNDRANHEFLHLSFPCAQGLSARPTGDRSCAGAPRTTNLLASSQGNLTVPKNKPAVAAGSLLDDDDKPFAGFGRAVALLGDRLVRLQIAVVDRPLLRHALYVGRNPSVRVLVDVNTTARLIA